MPKTLVKEHEKDYIKEEPHVPDSILYLCFIIFAGILFGTGSLFNSPAEIPHYGPVAGVVAGGLHMIFTTNITFLNTGMNLYNNGFSGGFIAAITLPVLENLCEMKDIKNMKNINEAQ